MRTVSNQNVVQYTGIQDLKISTTHLPADVQKLTRVKARPCCWQYQNAYQCFLCRNAIFCLKNVFKVSFRGCLSECRSTWWPFGVVLRPVKWKNTHIINNKWLVCKTDVNFSNRTTYMTYIGEKRYLHSTSDVVLFWRSWWLDIVSLKAVYIVPHNMSGKKPFLTAKSSTGEVAPSGTASTVPPRYQPPPIPSGTGILKHPVAKDATKHYPTKLPEQNLNPSKYYPVPQHQKPYYPSQYPPQAVPVRSEDHTRITQVQVHQADTRSRPLDEPGIPQVSLAAIQFFKFFT